MLKKKPFLVTFEGIEGSGKSYQSRKLYYKIKNLNHPVIYTREPGGTENAEKIRTLILSGAKNKYDKITDTLLYLASRNEHIKRIILPNLKKKKIIICDRYLDSTIAYQVYGKGVSKVLVDTIHKEILGDTKPDLTFILKIKMSKALKRIRERKIRNRYDKLSKSFYRKVQNAFIQISKTNKRRYIVLDNSNDDSYIEETIFKKIYEKLKK